MRSLSSTVRLMPSSWLPSRSVVSKTSTDSGSRTPTPLSDMFDPVLVLIDLAAHRREVRLLDRLGHRARLTDHAVVDLPDGNDLGGGASEERLVAHVEVAAQDVADLDAVAEVARDRDHRVPSDAFEGARRDRRRDELASPDDEDVLAGAFADVPLWRQQDGLVVAGLQRFHLGHRRVDVHTRALGAGRNRVGVVALPRADLRTHAVLQTLVAQVRPPGPHGDGDVHRARQRVEAHLAVAEVGDRADVALLEA